MRLKDLISYLEFKDENAIAVNGFGAPHSYRGWYEQIAFEPVEQTTAGDMLVCAREALGKTFTGWKGGDFYMDGNSFVNIAFQGDCGQDDEITVERLDAMFEKPLQRTWVGLMDEHSYLVGALRTIAEGTYDPWSNGAQAQRTAIAAIEKYEAAHGIMSDTDGKE